MAGIMDLFTIGFTKKTAKQFFELLKKNQVKSLIDTRLNNKSQLAGFTKKEDLEYFLKEIAGIKYVYKPEFAPSDEILTKYKKGSMDWEEYEVKYFQLLKERNILHNMDFSIFENACLLCSEHSPQNCHRRLLAEYLSQHNASLKIIHL